MGNFTRLDYDACTYRTNLTQSIGPGEYALAAYAAPNCGTCFSGDPWRQGGGGATARCSGGGGGRTLVDVDSELIGITRQATNCPGGLFQATAPPFCPTLLQYRDCPASTVGTEDTRLSNPPSTLRETGWNRWEWLCRDPQERVEVPFDYLINSQLIAKDAHRPCVPMPIDQTLALPPAVTGQAAPVYRASGACGDGAAQGAQQPQLISWKGCSALQALSG